jgi:hypothetical protein
MSKLRISSNFQHLLKNENIDKLNNTFIEKLKVY